MKMPQKRQSQYDIMKIALSACAAAVASSRNCRLTVVDFGATDSWYGPVGAMEYSKHKSIGELRPLLQAAGLPNLTPYLPSVWSDKIVVSRTTGTTSKGAVSP